MTLRFFLISLPLALAACTRPDSLYCDDNTPCTDPARPFCDLTGDEPASNGIGRTCVAEPGSTGQPDAGLPIPPDATAMCTESSQCSDELPICRDDSCEACTFGSAGNAECAERDSDLGICLGDGSCVECGSSNDCSDVNQPFCETSTGTCEACSEHGQCDSGACDYESGQCISDGDIIYVDSTSGSDGVTCGLAPGSSACQHIAGALGGLAKVITGRDYLVLAPGNYLENVSITGLTASIIGNGALLRPPGFSTQPPLSLNVGANISIEDMIIEDGNGPGSGVGINCLASTLALGNVTVRNNDDAGISTENCSLRLTDSQVSGNVQEGIKMRNGSSLTVRGSDIKDNGFHGLHIQSSAVDIRQSRIMDNETGGLYLFSSTFVVENNWIAKNGNLTSSPGNPTGGIVIETVPGPAISPQDVRHNTIAHNLAPAAVGSAGLVCNTGAGTGIVQCDSNIVIGNERPGEDVQTSGTCGVRYSMVTGITSGVGNVSVLPSFVSEATGDYHLAAGSAGIDIGEPGSPTTSDIDGENRPSGAGFDMGADER